MEGPPQRRPWRLIFGLLALLITSLTLSLPFLFYAAPHKSPSHRPPPFFSLDSSSSYKNGIILDKRASVSTTQEYQIVGHLCSGLCAELLLGSQNQTVLFSLDTTISYLVANNYTQTSNNVSTEEIAMAGFELNNSTTALSLQYPFNATNLDNAYAYGTLFQDSVQLVDNVLFPSNVIFGLAANNSLNVKNTNVVRGSGTEVVIKDNTTSTTNANFSTNILGLGMDDSDYSFLNQMLQFNISNSKLFSLYLDANQSPVVQFGSIDTSQYEGMLYLSPILTTMHIDAGVSTYEGPFVTLSGITLVNDDHGTSLNLSNNALSMPTLLDTTDVMSYLPYSLLVELAAQFGAYYSSAQSLWIQSCSFANINGSVGFQFFEVTIYVSLENLFVPLVNANGDSLYLESGDLACALAFSPAESRGFNSLGTPFFMSAYTVFDYSNKVVGLSQQGSDDNSSNSSSLVVVTDHIADVINATTMPFPGNFEPTAIRLNPQNSYNSYATTQNMTIDADSLVTTPPSTTSTPTAATTTDTSPTASETKNPNAVSVGSGGAFESGASTHTCPVYFAFLPLLFFVACTLV